MNDLRHIKAKKRDCLITLKNLIGFLIEVSLLATTIKQYSFAE